MLAIASLTAGVHRAKAMPARHVMLSTLRLPSTFLQLQVTFVEE